MTRLVWLLVLLLPITAEAQIISGGGGGGGGGGTVGGSGNPPALGIWLGGSTLGNYAGTALCPVGQFFTQLSASGQATCGAVVGGGGTVTSVTTSGPITGGPITASGTLACATCVISPAALTSTAIMTGGGSQGSQTPSAGTTLDGSGNLVTPGSLTTGSGGATTGSVQLSGVSSGTVTVTVNGAAGTWSMTLPTTGGTANQFLQTDGTGVTTWATPAGSGTVTTSGSPANTNCAFFTAATVITGNSGCVFNTGSQILTIGGANTTSAVTGQDATGTNTAGGNLYVSSGAGTGSAAGGTLYFTIGQIGQGSGSSVNGFVQVARFDPASGHFETHPGAAGVPAVTNTSANSCGTTAATIGTSATDHAGKITTGGTSATSCTITFAVAYTNEPSCSCTNETTGALCSAISTVSTVILSGTLGAASKVAYQCSGIF